MHGQRDLLRLTGKAEQNRKEGMEKERGGEGMRRTARGTSLYWETKTEGETTTWRGRQAARSSYASWHRAAQGDDPARLCVERMREWAIPQPHRAVETGCEDVPVAGPRVGAGPRSDVSPSPDPDLPP